MDKDPQKEPEEASPTELLDRCPRCGTDTTGKDACPRCGLAREHRARFAAETALPPGLAEAWDDVMGRWDDAGAHALFLELCAQAEALDLAAARYRALSEDPVRGERCRASLDRIVALAETALRRTASSADRVARNKRILLAVAALISVLFLVFVTWAVLTR